MAETPGRSLASLHSLWARGLLFQFHRTVSCIHGTMVTITFNLEDLSFYGPERLGTWAPIPPWKDERSGYFSQRANFYLHPFLARQKM